MRRLASALNAALAAALAVAGLALAQDDKPRTPLPVNAFAKAKEGDWAVLRGTVTAKPSGEKTEHFLRYRVQSGGGEDVITIVETGPFASTESARFLFGFGAKSGPSLEQLFSWTKLATFSDAKVSDEERKAGDRSFAGKKLSCTGSRSKDTCTITAWLSPEVKGCGLVAVELAGPDRDAIFELAGMGSLDKVEWGRSLDDLRAEWDKAHPKQESKK